MAAARDCPEHPRFPCNTSSSFRILNRMPTNESEEPGSTPAQRLFVTTHWSVVLAARDKASPECSRALETLCRTYWYPLYAFVRGSGYTPEDAQDLTQGFFAPLLANQPPILPGVQRTARPAFPDLRPGPWNPHRLLTAHPGKETATRISACGQACFSARSSSEREACQNHAA